MANGQGWNPTQPAPCVLCPSFCDTSGATPGSQRVWGCRSDLPFFSHDRERFALFAASLLCGAQVSGWGPFISGTDVLHRSRPWGQNRPLHGLRNFARTNRPASHSLTQMPSHHGAGLLAALSRVSPATPSRISPPVVPTQPVSEPSPSQCPLTPLSAEPL